MSNDFRKAEVVVRQVSDKSWQVEEPFSWTGARETFEVPKHMPTDFASVPRFFVWLLPRYGRWTKAAIVHDLFWRIAVPAGRLTYREADGAFRRMQRDLDVAFLRRWIMWAAVRVGALFKEGGRKDWWKDAPRVLLVAVVALPVVALPAVTIAVSLVIFYAMEWLLWSVLWVARSIGRLGGYQPKKQLNSPSLMLKMDY